MFGWLADVPDHAMVAPTCVVFSSQSIVKAFFATFAGIVTAFGNTDFREHANATALTVLEDVRTEDKSESIAEQMAGPRKVTALRVMLTRAPSEEAVVMSWASSSKMIPTIPEIAHWGFACWDDSSSVTAIWLLDSCH